jgi:hypothetical protein
MSCLKRLSEPTVQCCFRRSERPHRTANTVQSGYKVSQKYTKENPCKLPACCCDFFVTSSAGFAINLLQSDASSVVRFPLAHLSACLWAHGPGSHHQ